MTQKQVKLWVCSDMYFPEDVSTGYYMTRIAEGLTASAAVSVLCGQPSYAQQGEKAPSFERRNGTTIKRVWATSFSKDRLFLRLINVVTYMISMTFVALFSFKRGDFVLCVTNPPTLPPLLGFICRIKKSRLILLVHDVFPETLAAVSGFSKKSMTYRTLERFSNFAYRSAEIVVTLGRDMKNIAQDKGAVNVKIIENWADLDEIFPIPRSENVLIKELGLEGKRILQYSGNIGRTHDIESILKIAAALEDYPEWVVLFAGFGGKKNLIEAAAKRKRSNIVVVPRQPRGRLNQLLNASDLVAIAFVPGMIGLSVPSRMYNVMAAGKPILALCEAQSELALVVSEDNCGWHFDPTQDDTVSRVLECIIDTEAVAAKGQNALAVARQKYDYASALNKYQKIIT
jgi:glycosyltransferase involved in cell wall biosynthesis